MLRFQREDDITKIFNSNKYIGYINSEDEFYLFNSDGYAEFLGTAFGHSDVLRLMYDWEKSQTKPSPTPKQDKMIGILMAHLVIHEPDANIIKEAKAYLRSRAHVS